LTGLAGVVERNVYLVKRYAWWEVAFFGYTLASSYTIVLVAKGIQATGGRLDVNRVTTVLLIGAVVWAYLSGIFEVLTDTVAWERWEGTIEYTFMAPVGRVTHLMGICLFAIGYGFVRTLVVFAVAVAFFNLDFSHANFAGAMAVLAASTLPLIGLSILTAVLPLLSPQKGEQMSFAVQGFMLLVSGVYYPLSVLPAPLQAAGYASPLTYALQGIRETLLNGASICAEMPTIGILIGMGALMIPGAILVFSWAERRAKRLGLLKRSG
jgi:ABC-2 type transport system permease protein